MHCLLNAKSKSEIKILNCFIYNHIWLVGMNPFEYILKFVCQIIMIKVWCCQSSLCFGFCKIESVILGGFFSSRIWRLLNIEI